MVDSPREPGTAGPPATPGWVKALGLGIVVVVLLVIVAILVVGGEHGPGRHTGFAGAGAETPAATEPAIVGG